MTEEMLQKDSDFSKEKNRVQVIDRAIKILRTLRDSGGLTITQLSKSVGLSYTTTHRIIHTLAASNLVAINSNTGRTELGPELISFGATVFRDIRNILRPYLRSLSDEINEVIDLSIYDSGRMLFIDQLLKPLQFEMKSSVGLSYPLHCTANGKAFLAQLSVSQIEKILPEQLEVFTKNTINSRKELIQEIQEIKIKGYAIDHEEHEDGICSVGIGVPATIARHAYISIPMPTDRFQKIKDQIISALMETKKEIYLCNNYTNTNLY